MTPSDPRHEPAPAILDAARRWLTPVRTALGDDFVAAALTGKLPVRGRVVAVVCSGGNVDHETYTRALARRA